MFAAFLFERMGYKNIFSPKQAKVPYRWIYTRRPDGQLMRDGDSFISAQTPLGTYWSSPFHLMLTSSFYKDPYLKAEFLKQYQLTLGRYVIDDIWMLLFDDPNVKPVTNTALPLTKYFGDPFGTMVARTSWDTGKNANTVVAEMKVGGIWFANHQHLDAAQFQIYYKGGLAIDAGIYEGTKGAYGSEHDRNFHKRTIAHNTMLVYDSAEQMVWGRNRLSNDGGQRYPNFGYEPVKAEDLFAKGYRVANVIAHAIGPDSLRPGFSYLKGNITNAYSKKVTDFRRSFVFLNFANAEHPAAMIVYDRVVSANPAFKKTWLLHSIEEPAIVGNNATINRTENGYNGRLVNTTLLPVAGNAVITKVGGAGKAFLVDGVNYEQYVNRANSSEEAGQWRIEISPKQAKASDHFLNVLQVTENKEGQRPLEATMKEHANHFSVTVADRIVFFSKSAEKTNVKMSFMIQRNKQMKVLITDLQPGTWQLKKSGKKVMSTIVFADNGTFYFDAGPGDYSLELI
jgi:heparin/heparan-sulfate lyase